MKMKNRSKIIAIIAICGVAMLMLLISQYKNLNAQREGEDKAGGRLAYRAGGDEMPERNRGNQNAAKDDPARGKNSDANQDKESKGDSDLYRVVVENNLFRPLGWQRPNREPQYTLMATFIASKGNSAKALVMEQRSHQSYYVSVGGKVGGATVEKIKSNEVTLNQAGKMMTIRAEPIQFLSGSDGKSGGPPSSPNRENRPNPNPENRGGEQPNWNQMKNQFQNASREERIQILKAAVAAGKMSEAEAKAIYNKMEDKGKGEDKAEVADKAKEDYKAEGDYKAK
jgi:hypothetical protein